MLTMSFSCQPEGSIIVRLRFEKDITKKQPIFDL